MAYLSERGIDTETAARFRLGMDPETGRLSIPYLSPAGPLSIKLRCVEDHNCKALEHQKYMAPPASQPYLFNAQALITADRVVVVEGELDAIAAEQEGIPAVGYPGVSTWQANDYWRYCFDSCAEVVVVADGDDPGKGAGRAVVTSLRDVVDDVKMVVLPGGHDTNSFIGAYGVGAFLERIDWL